MKFMILANPRSRTKWLAEYLSAYGARVGHDQALGCSSVDEFVTKISDLDGVVETGIALGYKLWITQFPYARFIVIHRTVISIAKSFEKLGFAPDWTYLYMQEVMLGRFISDYNVMFYTFESLNHAETRKSLCEYTIGSFDSKIDEESAPIKIEIDPYERLKYLKDNAEEYSSFCNDIAKKVVYLENDSKC